MTIGGLPQRLARIIALAGVLAIAILVGSLAVALENETIIWDWPLVMIRHGNDEIQAMITKYPDCVPVGFSCGPKPLPGTPIPTRNYFVVYNVVTTPEANGQTSTAERWLALPLGP